MPRYDETMVKPMREELTGLGFQELRTPEEVEAFFQGPARQGTALLVVNSVCGCAAGGARPGVALALGHRTRPQQLATVFAGQDQEATVKARSYITGYPPSSPSIALFRDGKLAAMMQRQEIEGRPPELIAESLKALFEQVEGAKAV